MKTVLQSQLNTNPKILFIALLAMAFGLNVFNVNAQCFTPITFSGPNNIAMGGGTPRAIVTADFNGDGKLDLAVANLSGSNVTIMLGAGNGTFIVSPTTYASAGQPHAMTSGDVNGDGKIDLIIANHSTSNISILTGNGDGTFNTAVNYGSGFSSIRSIVAADFNGDGKLDFAAASNGNTQMCVFINNGSMSFTQSAAYATGGGTFNLVAADFNGDGKLDIASANTSGSVSVFLNKNDGLGGMNAAINTTVSAATGLELGDFDGDGKVDDLVVVNNASGVHTAQVLLGDGTGHFTNGTTGINVGDGPQWGCTADFNNDGLPDVAIACSGQSAANNQVAVLLGGGTAGGIMSAAVTLTTGTTSYTNTCQTVAGDFNNDGRLDIAAINSTGSAVTIFLNTTATASFTSTSPLCGSGSNTTLTFTGSPAGMTSYTWAGPNSFASSSQNPASITNAPVANAGIYTLTVVNGSGCTAVAMATVVIANPTATASATTPICTNNTLNLTGGAAGLTSYAWTGPNGFTSSSQSPGLANPTTAAAGIYSLKVTNSGGCTASASTAPVTINAAPASTNLTPAICAGQSFTVGTHIYKASGTYTDRLTAANGCDSIVITKLSVLYGNSPTGTFTSGNASPAGGDARGIVTADFNNDGFPDVAISTLNSSNISIFLNNGAGVFTKAASSPISNPNGRTHYINAGDFNGDGKMDLVTANLDNSTVTIFTGNGTGGFTATTVSQATGQFSDPRSVVCRDFNGDGKIDLAVANNSGAKISILFGNGNSTFTFSKTYSSGTGPYTIISDDFNNDGVPDLAMANSGQSTVTVFLNKGDGTFGSAIFSNCGTGPYGCISGDFNADGKIDLAVPLNGTSQVAILIGNGDGTFATPVLYATPTNPQWGVAADFNGDGKLDIAVGCQTTGTADILYGTGTGTFTTPAQQLTAGTQAIQVVSADFNGDGTPDMAVANNSSTNVTILLNKTSLASITTNSPVCTSGSKATLNLTAPSGATGYTWSGPNSFTSTLQNPSVGSLTTVNTGTYSLTVTDSHSCSASSSAAVVVNSPVTVNLPPVIACGSYTIGATTYTTSGPVTTTLTGSNGCDSIINVTLTINQTKTTSQTFNFCAGDGQVAHVGTHSYNVAGLYIDKLIAASGCDSIVTTRVNEYFGSLTTTAAYPSPGINTNTVNNNGRGIATADFNNDGKPDLVTVDYNASRAYIYINNGSASSPYPATPTYNFSVGASGPHAVNVGDFNNDGKMDFVTANNASSSVTLFTNNGGGSFTTTIVATSANGLNQPRGVTCGDFNRDGKLDMAVLNNGGNAVTMLINNGGGTFTASQTGITNTSGIFILTDDFNKDGIPDLAEAAGTVVSVLTGNGAGNGASFTINNYAHGATSCYGIVDGDFNNDGYPDIASINNTSTGSLSVLLNNGSGGGFTLKTGSPFAFNFGSNSQWSCTGDFNGDGNIDIAVVDAGTGNSVYILTGKGDGTFNTKQTLTAHSGPSQVITGDFNGDGRPDLAAINAGSDVSLFLNNGISATSNSPVCTSGTNSTLNLSVSAGTSYSWSGPNSFTSTLQNPVVSSLNSLNTGTYSVSVTGANHNCAAVITTPVVVNSPVTVNLPPVIACGSYKIGTTTYTTSGPVTTTLTGSNGCDSIINITLTINQTKKTSQTFNFCAGDGQVAHVGTHSYNVAGLYIDKLTAASGCDSIITTRVNEFFGSNTSTFSFPATSTNTNNVGNTGRGIVTADFNNDGKADIAIAAYASSQVFVYLNQGNGTFPAAPTYTIAVGSGPHDINAGDFDNDGKIDIVTPDRNGVNYASLLHNTGSGFTVSTVGTGMNDPRNIVCADFNHDGNLDMAVANTGGTNVTILMGNGANGFTSSNTATVPGSGIFILSADFNRDGIPDIAEATGSTITVLTGTGAGGGAGFTINTYSNGASAYGVVSGDFNNDGYPDLGSINNSASGTVSILLNNGSGGGFTLQPSPITGFNNNTQWSCTGDFNGDGNIDIAVADAGISNVFLLPGNGNGTFGTKIALTAGNGPCQVVTGDFNNDGRPDLAAVNSNASVASASVFLNTGITASSNSPVCTSGTNSALNLSVSAGISYSWSGPNSFTSSLQNPIVGSLSTLNTGTYSVSVTGTNHSCATVTTMPVVVNSPVSFAHADVTACGSYTIGTFTHTSSGTFSDILTSSKGCDSIVTTNITILQPGTFSQTLSVCAGQSVKVGTISHTTTGTYVDHLTAANGCDSAVTTKLTVLYGNGGNATFTTATPAPGGSGPRGIVTTDLNNDGKLDLAICDLSSGQVTVSLGNGTGGFTTSATPSVGGLPHYINYGDFNGDGKMDLVTANYNSSSITILLGNGAGGFSSVTTLSGGTYGFNDPRSVVSADFNGDGKADLAVANNSGASVSILLGNGNGTFVSASPATVASGGGPYDIHAADFNNDGKVDLAMVTSATTTVTILLGNGNGTFAAAIFSPVGGSPYGCVVGDFNGDGKMDLAATINNNSFLEVLIGNGTGGFAAPVQYACPTNPQWGVAADFNGDGILDIAVGAQISATADVFYGTGTGTFSTAQSLPASTQAIMVAAGDFNGDGKLDMAVANNGASNATILLNSTVTLVAPATANASTPICPNTTLSLTGGPAGLNNYAWSGPNGYSVTGQNPTLDNPTTSGAGVYTLTITDSRGCTGTANTPTVVMKPLPPIAVSPASAVCTGLTNAILTASGANSYSWSPISNLTPSVGTAVTETAQISQLTFYTVTGTATNGCTNNVVVPVATVATGGTISPVYSIICSGGTKPLTVSGAAGHNYQWQISVDNANWSDISGATNTTYTTNTTDGNTNKYYRLQAQSNSCWNVASTTAEVDVSQPTINVTTSALTDNSVTLNWAPIGSGNYTINYTGASTGTVLGTTPPKTLNNLTANGNYTITLNQTGAGLGTCPASGTATVTTLCPAPTAVTIISTGTNSITLTWTGGAGNYRVYYRPLYVNNGYFTKDVIGGTSTSLTKQGSNSLYHSLTYEIYVTKLDCPALGNVGQPSAKVYATTTPALACAAPVIDSVKSACPVQLEVFMHGSPTNQYFIDVERLTPTIQPVQSFPVTGSYFTANVSAGQNYLITARSRCGIAVSNLTLWPGALQVKPQCGTLNNLLLSNPTCNGFTASWNADQCLANNASYYELYIRQVGTLNWNGYGVIIPTYPIGPYKLVNWLPRGKSYDVYAKAVYSCNGYLTYGATTQTTRITTLSAGCREEASNEEQLKPITQQTSPDNSEVFTLYPNPNSGKFTVDLSRLNTNEDAVRIEVTNILGQTVITQLTSISDGHLTEFINMPASIAAGTYIVRVTAGKNVYTSKINVSK